MTRAIDHAVSADLALLATNVRSGAPSLDAILPADRGEPALLELAMAYVDRSSRATAGAAMLATIVGALVLLEIEVWTQTITLPAAAFDLSSKSHAAVDFVMNRHERWPWSWLDELHVARHVLAVVAVVAIIGGVARRFATKRFARVVETRDPLAAARSLLARAEPWFVALWTSGLVAMLALFAMTICFHLDGVGMRPLWPALLRVPWLFAELRAHDDVAARIRDVCIVVGGATIASFWIARRRPAWLRASPVAWLALAVALVALGCEFALGMTDARHGYAGPDDVRRTLVVLGGGLALVVSLAAFALRSVQRRQ